MLCYHADGGQARRVRQVASSANKCNRNSGITKRKYAAVRHGDEIVGAPFRK